jgi:hypothetical protein
MPDRNPTPIMVLLVYLHKINSIGLSLNAVVLAGQNLTYFKCCLLRTKFFNDSEQ